MTLHDRGKPGIRRRRRGPAIMVWLFMCAAVGIFAVFVVQVSGFNIGLLALIIPAPLVIITTKALIKFTPDLDISSVIPNLTF